MYIRKLDIRGFGKLSGLALDLKPGLNVIYGDNEAGKSTLQAFIRGMLFGLKGGRATREGVLSPVKRYRPWQSDEFRGILEYALDNGEVYRVERNFSTNTVRIYDAAYNDITGTFDISREKGVLFAEKQLGMTEACFEKTVHIRQMEVRLDSEGSSELLGRLVNASQTGFEDISFKKAQEALREAVKQYSGTDRTTTRPLDRIRARLESCRTEKGILAEKRRRGTELERQLGAVRADIQGKGRRKAFLETLLGLQEDNRGLELLKAGRLELERLLEEQEKLEGYSAFCDEDIDSVLKDWQKLRLVDELQRKTGNELDACKREIAYLEQELQEYKGFKLLGPAEAEQLPELMHEVDKLSGRQPGHDIELLNEQMKNARFRERMLLYLVGALIPVFIAFLWLGWSANRMLWSVLPVDLLVAGILWRRKKAWSAEAAELTARKRKAALHQQETAREFENQKKAVSNILRLAGAETLEEYYGRKAAYDNRMSRLTDLGMRLEKLQHEQAAGQRNRSLLEDSLRRRFALAGIDGDAMDDSSVRAFSSGIRRYAGVRSEIDRVVQRLGGLQLWGNAADESAAGRVSNTVEFAPDEIDSRIKGLEDRIQTQLAAIRTEYADSDAGEEGTELPVHAEETEVQAELHRLADEITYACLKEKELETLLQGTEEENDGLQRLEEEILVLEQQETALADLRYSLTTALEVLSEASGEIQKETSPGLNARINHYISQMTRGRYHDFKADTRLVLKTPSPETQEIIPAAVLSGGTVDQVYLALRLAMAELLEAKGERLPLLLDEVFAQYDDQRTRDTLSLLTQLSGDRQILLLTCKNREVELAKEIGNERANVLILF